MRDAVPHERAPAASAPFPPAARLKKKSDFLRVQNSGRKIYSKHFLIIASEAPGKTSRLGVTITRKVDPRATRRNRLRRRIRELFRMERHRLKGAWDVLIIARRDSPLCSFEDVRREILGALQRCRLIDPAKDSAPEGDA